jgi:type VI secretion system protein ImpE
MSTASMAQQSLRDGDPGLALQQLQEQVRAAPADARLRLFLFQLLAVRGDWERAQAQLAVASTLDASALAMMPMYREAIGCECLRARVFEGRAAPLTFGPPAPWMALLIESLLTARCAPAQAEQLRARAFEQAMPVSGTLDGQAFGWIADADSRLGPVLEAFIEGHYYWVPFAQLRAIAIDAPHDLRDVVWMPARFVFADGGEAAGLIPTRYPGSEAAADPLLALSRKTAWRQAAPGLWHGLGQRIIATDGGESALMDVRRIVIDAPEGPG